MTTESIARDLKRVLFSAAIGVEATDTKGQIIWEARGLVNDLIDALSTPPTDEKSIATPKPGRYRNDLGAELLVTGAWLPNLRGESRQTLGDIATAQTPEDIFGVTHYLVTSRSLAAAGYVFIPREDRDDI